MTIALHGNLTDFGMGEVFQLIGQQRKTGVLQVRGSRGEVELRFEGGGVVSAAPVGAYEDAALGEMALRCGVLPREKLTAAERERSAGADALRPHLVAAGLAREQIHEVEDLLTRETLFDLLRWDDGSFRFVAQPVPHDRPPDSLLGAEQVLMDGLRMVDEWRAFAAEIPAESTVYRRRDGIEEYRRSAAARTAANPAETERLLLLVDGRSSVRRVIDLSRLGTFLGMRILVELARGGWIEPLRASDDGVRGTALRPAARLRSSLAGFGPFAVLVLLAVLAFARGPSGGPGAPIARDALAEARAAAEMVRLRRLLVAERLARGADPGSLAEVRSWPDGAGSSLAAGEAGAYHVARHARAGRERLIVLAPER
jgi:hypothetical protein